MDPTISDPWSPQPGAPPAAQPEPQQGDLSQQWTSALNDPNARAALLQFGISMMQPRSFGDTFGSQFGRALGSAGEAVGRQDEAVQKAQESDSKQALRTAQANRAEAAAAIQGVSTDYKMGQLKNMQDRLTLSKIIQRQGRQIQAANGYTNYLKQANDPLNPQAKPLTQEEWYRQSGFGDLLPGGSSDTSSNDPEVQAAKDAIASGRDPAAVRQKYKERTGKDAPF